MEYNEYEGKTRHGRPKNMWWTHALIEIWRWVVECGGQGGESSMLKLKGDHVTIEKQRQKEMIKERCDEEFQQLTTKREARG